MKSLVFRFLVEKPGVDPFTLVEDGRRRLVLRTQGLVPGRRLVSVPLLVLSRKHRRATLFRKTLPSRRPSPSLGTVRLASRGPVLPSWEVCVRCPPGERRGWSDGVARSGWKREAGAEDNISEDGGWLLPSSALLT